MKRRIAALLLALVTCVSLFAGITAGAAGYAPKYTKEAEALYTLGLFQGMGKNADGTPKFALEQKATRIQGLVMLIRLLGKETDALAYAGECPFTDVPAWAEKYAAYAYDNGITKGTSATTFSADAPLLGKAYVTFVLRALGYDDAAGDFSYNEALVKGKELGLVEAGACTGDIYRDDCAVISYNALKTKMKGTDTMLATKLLNDGVLTSAALESSKLFFGEVKVAFTVTPGDPHPTKYKLGFLGSDLLAAFPTAAYFCSGGWGGVTKASFDRMEHSLLGIWMGSWAVRDNASGGSILPNVTYTAPTNGGDNMSIITVLDKDLNLLGYSFLYPWYPMVDGEMTFTTVFYNGKEDSKQLDAIFANVKKFSGEALYCERIITKNADGTETEKVYLRVDEGKWPKDLAGFQYYSIEAGGSREDWERVYRKGRSLCVYGEDTLPSVNYGSGVYLFIYNDNKDLVACVSFPEELPVVEIAVGG